MGQTFLNTSLWYEFLYVFYHWHTFQWYTLSFPWKKECHVSSSLQKQKNGPYWSLKYSFPCFLFFRLLRASQKWKTVIFMLAPYILYLAHEAMGIFYIIHLCHHVSFLACLHPINLHCHKPHQKAFPLPTKGSGIPFLIISMVSFDTQFSIFYFYLFSTTTKETGGRKTY